MESFIRGELDKHEEPGNYKFYYFDISEKVAKLVYNLFKSGSINKTEDKSLTDNEKSDLNVYYAVYYMILEKYDIVKNYLTLALKLNPNNSHAIHRLAYLYHEGKGVEKNIETAKILYSKADELNNSNSMYNLGSIYFEENNIEKAKEFFTKSTNLGNPLASYELANIYFEEKNIEKAMDLYTKSANLGNASASNELGLLYYNGGKVKKDLELSFKWIKKAEELSMNKPIARILIQLGYMFLKGIGTTKDINKTLEYYQRASILNDSNASYRLGSLYYDGKFVQRDYKKAVEYFTKAAAFENAEALFCLGLCRSSGRGIEKDTSKAVEYYEKAIKLGHVRAHSCLGRIYYNAKNYKSAVEYYQKAVKLNDSRGFLEFGICYYYGFGVDKNPEKAFECFSKSRKLDDKDRDTIYYLGLCHYHGSGTPVNYFKALRYFGLIREYRNSDILISCILRNRNDLISSMNQTIHCL